MMFVIYPNCIPAFDSAGPEGPIAYTAASDDGSISTDTSRSLLLVPKPKGFGLPKERGFIIVSASNPMPRLKVGDKYLTVASVDVNGSVAWGSRDDGQCFFDGVNWILFPPYSSFAEVTTLASGYFESPKATVDIDDETIIGDGWWQLRRAPSLGNTITLTRKGTLLNPDSSSIKDPDVKLVYPRYENIGFGRSSPYGMYGRYRAVDFEDETERPDLLVGAPVFRQGAETDIKLWRKQPGADMWIRDREANQDEEPDIGRVIAKSDDVYVIGTRNSGTWWESKTRPEPFGSSAEFDEFTMDGALPTSTGRTFSLDFAYLDSPPADSKITLYSAEVPTWLN